MANVRAIKVESGVPVQISATADTLLVGGLAVGSGSPAATDVISIKNHAAFTGSECNWTTGAVQTVNNAATVIKALTLTDNISCNLLVTVVARRTDAAGRSGFMRRAVVFREAAGAATLVGTVDTIGADKTSGTITASATINVSGNDVRVVGTGANGQTISWVCTIQYQGVRASV